MGRHTNKFRLISISVNTINNLYQFIEQFYGKKFHKRTLFFLKAFRTFLQIALLHLVFKINEDCRFNKCLLSILLQVNALKALLNINRKYRFWSSKSRCWNKESVAVVFDSVIIFLSVYRKPLTSSWATYVNVLLYLIWREVKFLIQIWFNNQFRVSIH